MTTIDDGVDDAVDAAAPLDILLGDATTSLRRWLPGREGLRFAGALVRAPRPVARVAATTVRELVRVTAGRSALEPGKKDKRFADPAWSGNPVLHRVMQAYLATGAGLDDLLAQLDLDWHTEQRIRFLTENVVEAIAPTNSPLLNPTAWKAAIDSGGATLARGTVSMVRDLATAPRVPRMVEPGAFVVGRDLAVTPGHVVFRNDLIELIEYTPQTDTVHQVPLLIVPPTINKFYVVDLAPGRSLVEHLVGAGQQVFLISWRNPGPDGRAWGADAYAEAVLAALDVVEEISGSPRTALLALCSGGMLTTMLMAHLAAIGDLDRIAALSLLVTVLDQARAGTLDALADERTTTAATARSARQGYLDGAALAEVFAWLRPRDLVWNYWVNNYLLGKPPPAFDILAWNADSTRMPARLHRDFIDITRHNQLTHPGAATLCGSPVDLSRIDLDAYVVAGVADHLCPWQNCYQTTQLLGGTTRFVLSTSGHIAAIINPPGKKNANYRTATHNPPDARTWLASTEQHPGSWWQDYTTWLAEHSGDERAAPKEPGSPDHPALITAPGTYVLEP